MNSGDNGATGATATQAGHDGLGFRPLYRQVRDRLMQRIAEGHWQPGQALPSEPQIAAEFGVSQGTVRKALDEMAADNMLLRRQGKGTFVSGHDEQRILFQYFKLIPDTGVREFPESMVIACQRAAANLEELTHLELPEGASVIRIRRVRSLAGQPRVSEQIVLPAQLFEGLDGQEIPNNLYSLYASRFGITIARATEKLKAVGAALDDALALRIPAGAPVLRIDRVARAINGVAAEWRVSVCRTDHAHYLSDLR